MCTQVLTPLRVGQLQELPSFGDDCVVHAAKKAIAGNIKETVDKITAHINGVSDSEARAEAYHELGHEAENILSAKFHRASYLVVWAIFIMLATIVGTRIYDQCQGIQEEKREIRRELAHIRSVPTETPRSERAAARPDAGRAFTEAAMNVVEDHNDRRKIEDAVDEPMDTQEA